MMAKHAVAALVIGLLCTGFVLGNDEAPTGQRSAATDISNTDSRATTAASALPGLQPWPIRQPRLIHFSQDRVGPGRRISVRGEGFDKDPASNRVVLAGIDCPVVAATDTSLEFLIPPGAASGQLHVQTSYGRSKPLPMIVDSRYAPHEITAVDSTSGFVAGQVLVAYRAGTITEEDRSAIIDEYGLLDQVHFPDLGIYVAYVSATQPEITEQCAARLRVDARVAIAMPNYLAALQGRIDVNDPCFGLQTHLQPGHLDIERALGTHFPQQGAGIRIGIIDSPVAGFSTDVVPVAEKSFEFAFTRIGDRRFHGPAVASVAAGRMDDELGVGVAPRAEIVSAVIGPLSSLLDILEAVDWCVAQRARVINLSSGAALPAWIAQMQFFWRSFQRAVDADVVLVAAAGNDGETQLGWPACDSRWVGIGSAAVSESAGVSRLARARHSNYGPDLDWLALGENIMTEDVDTHLCGAFTGTSFAAPQFAGLAALVLAEEPALDPEAVLERIRADFTADIGALGRDDDTGFGMIRIPFYDLSNMVPANGVTLDGGGNQRPRVRVTLSNWGQSLDAYLEFFADGESLGEHRIFGPGTFEAPGSIELPNLMDIVPQVEFRAVLRQGNGASEHLEDMISRVQTRFSPAGAFGGRSWDVTFHSVRDVGSYELTWTATGHLDAVRAASWLTLTVVDGYPPGRSRTCTYTGNDVYSTFGPDDIYIPVHYRFYWYIYGCLSGMTREISYDIMDLANPAPIHEIRNGDCVVRSEMTFGSRNVTTLEMTRTDCIHTERCTLTRSTGAQSGVPGHVAASAARDPAVDGLVAEPSPARHGTRFRFTTPREGSARLLVYDARGRRVLHRELGVLESGENEAWWDLRSGTGRRVSAGLYFGVLESAGSREVVRVMVVK